MGKTPGVCGEIRGVEIVAYIKIAVLAIGLLYFMYRAGVAADAGNTADVIYYLFFVWLIARE